MLYKSLPNFLEHLLRLAVSPEAFAYGNIIVSYAIALILLAIGSGIAKVFLYTGSSLVQSGIESLLERFRAR